MRSRPKMRPDPSAFGRGFGAGLGVKLLVSDMTAELAFQTGALAVEIVWQEPYFAILQGCGATWMVHADRAYRDHPLGHAVAGLGAQAERLLNLSRLTAETSDLAVVFGDFNVEPGSTTLRLFEEQGMTELVTDRAHGGTRTSFYRKPGKFADYMLVFDTSRVKRFDVTRSPEVSGHCPLFLETR